MIRSIVIDKLGGCTKDIPVDGFRGIISDKNKILWVDMTNPDSHELAILSEVFEFHPLSVEDSAKVIELPKIDDFEDYIFVVFHRLEFDIHTDIMNMQEIDFFLGKNYIVSIHKKNSNSVDGMFDKLDKNNNLYKSGPDFIMHGIMDSIVDDYFPILDSWQDEIDQMEQRIISSRTEKVLKKILTLKRDFTNLRKSIGPQRDVINKLARRDYRQISQKAAIYYRDVHDHLLRIYSTLESLSDMLTVAFDAYVSSESNKLNVTSNQMNSVMQKLTLISTIFLPLTFIASVYGMNFDVMPELRWHYSYFVVMGLMIFLALYMYFFFKKRHLL